jgi:adhesin/invasin
LYHQPLQQPHWRFKLIGERYFGRTLSERDKTRCHNQSIVTTGVDFTPVPLITAGYGYRLGSGKQKTHQLQLALTYRLGIPLMQQLDTHQVAAVHSLAGNRLALVQRNNQIVLQQQPNNEIQLELPSTLQGKIGTLKP